jgi:dipeptidyl-peptidase-4
VVAELAKSDLSKFEELGLKKVEVFTFTSVDGVTQLHGMIHFHQPLIPQKNIRSSSATMVALLPMRSEKRLPLPDALTEYGFLC